MILRGGKKERKKERKKGLLIDQSKTHYGRVGVAAWPIELGSSHSTLQLPWGMIAQHASRTAMRQLQQPMSILAGYPGIIRILAC